MVSYQVQYGDRDSKYKEYQERLTEYTETIRSMFKAKGFPYGTASSPRSVMALMM